MFVIDFCCNYLLDNVKLFVCQKKLMLFFFIFLYFINSCSLHSGHWHQGKLTLSSMFSICICYISGSNKVISVSHALCGVLQWGPPAPVNPPPPSAAGGGARASSEHPSRSRCTAPPWEAACSCAWLACSVRGNHHHAWGVMCSGTSHLPSPCHLMYHQAVTQHAFKLSVKVTSAVQFFACLVLELFHKRQTYLVSTMTG